MSTESSETMVGHNAQNENTVANSHKCPVCLLLLQNPVQLTACGHRLCQSCVAIQSEYVSLPAYTIVAHCIHSEQSFDVQCAKQQLRLVK